MRFIEEVIAKAKEMEAGQSSDLVTCLAGESLLESHKPALLISFLTGKICALLSTNGWDSTAVVVRTRLRLKACRVFRKMPERMQNKFFANARAAHRYAMSRQLATHNWRKAFTTLARIPSLLP